ncbi:BRICHOS domain-containing protein 5 [Candoia aspera]|uniref:BRICHOS domain-containing protein 5 n=1 Tax=Candoia aspera TaxID=51853 RepID=UPI002FD7EF93
MVLTLSVNESPILMAERAAPAESRSPSRIFGATLSTILTCGIICITVAATVSFSQASPKPLLQVIRLNLQDRLGSLMNQSVVVSKAEKTIIYHVMSSSNQTTAVLFDCKNGYVCYKPSGQSNCYLKRMDARDQDAAQASFDLSEHKGDPPLLPSDGTQYYREFLGVVPGSLVQPEEAGEAARALCEQAPIHWVKKKDDPPKQRLIYLCIDICFPNNICISICFYYLPE